MKSEKSTCHSRVLVRFCTRCAELPVRRGPTFRCLADAASVQVEYAGVNFIDTYQRGGIYKLPMPFILGNESAGEVVALGEGGDMHGLKVGDKVAVSVETVSLCGVGNALNDEPAALSDRPTLQAARWPNTPSIRLPRQSNCLRACQRGRPLRRSCKV